MLTVNADVGETTSIKTDETRTRQTIHRHNSLETVTVTTGNAKQICKLRSYTMIRGDCLRQSDTQKPIGA